MERELVELLEKEKIKEVIHRIARATDRADVELFASGYHPGAIDDHGLYSGPVEGLLAVFEEANKVFLCTQHSVTNIQISLMEDSADAETYLDAFHRRRDDEGKLWDEWLMGRYLDKFEKRGGAWKIALRQCLWDWTRLEPASTTTWSDAVGGNFLYGRRDKSDPLYATSFFKHGNR